jgi:hypothetical protein
MYETDLARTWQRARARNYEESRATGPSLRVAAAGPLAPIPFPIRAKLGPAGRLALTEAIAAGMSQKAAALTRKAKAGAPAARTRT